MNKNKEQMPVKYKQLDNEQGSDFYFERSLDLIFSPGCFTVEIDHSGKDVGLPIDDCGEEHYFVGNLVVTDSGTAGHKQENRVTGQQLTITSRKGKETKVFTRTFADGVWSQWRSLARTGMYDNISTPDELLATVESLVDENTRAKEVEEGVKRSAVDISSLACTVNNVNAVIASKSMDGQVKHSVGIPTATIEKAGVMSAEDKRRMAACNSYLVNDASNLQDAINALSNILPNDDKVSGVIVNFVDENGSLRSFVFSSNVEGFTNPKRWIDIAANQTYIVDDKPANRYRLSELIENIKIQADGEFDVNATYSIGQIGYAPSFGSNIVEIKKDGARLGIIYFNDSLVGELDASNLKIIVSVKSFGETEGTFDYSQYNRINPQLFIDAYESWKLNAIEAVANKNTTAIAVVADDLSADINSVKDVVYESDIVAVDTMEQQGKYYNSLGGLVDDSARCCTVPFDVVAGERYYITCRIGGSTVIAYVAMWGADGEWLGVADGFTGGSGNAVDRVFIVPEGVEKVAVSSYNTTSPSVTKSIRSNSTAYYTKREVEELIDNIEGIEQNVSSCVREKRISTLFLGENLLSSIVASGEGWSHESGVYTHTFDGDNDALVFNFPTVAGRSYVATIYTDVSSYHEGDVNVSIGGGALCDIYRGNEGPNYVGMVSDGGFLKITPSTIKDITVWGIELREVVAADKAVTTVDFQKYSVDIDSRDITGFWNVAVGSAGCMESLQNGSRNIAIGNNALTKLTSGERNIAIGTFSLNQLVGGTRNISIGADAMYRAGRADMNVAIGKTAAGYTHAVPTEHYYELNTALGHNALGGKSKNYINNVAVGAHAMGMGTKSDDVDLKNNTAVGFESGYYDYENNTSVGYRAGRYLKGYRNVAVGSMAGDSTQYGDDNIIIGYNARINDGVSNWQNPAKLDNTIVIGANSRASKSNQVVIGNTSQTEFIVLGNKKLNFNTDGTVTWEEIV